MDKKTALGSKEAKLLSGSERLCTACLERQGATASDSKKLGVGSSSCGLCHGASAKLDQISVQAIKALSEFEFETFLVGATLPQVVLDAEDEIRARFKIRGREGIKTQTTRAIARKIQRRLSKKIDYSRPDITLLASLVDGSVSTIPRSVWLSAAYTKSERGLPQRSSTCRVCNGVGCASCNYKGSSAQSVESILSSYFREIFLAESCNFIWIGNEDSESLVEGSGRPFYAELVRPKKRKMRSKSSRAKRPALETKVKLGPIALSKVEILQARPKSIPQFRIRCLVYLVESPLGSEARKIDSGAIERFQDATVQVHLSRKFRVTMRKIYSTKVVANVPSHPFALEIVCDGGIPIRKLVTGEAGIVVPNLSEYVKGYSIDPNQPFDILEIEIMPSRPLGFQSGPRRRKRHGRPAEETMEADAGSGETSSQELLLEG